jgi:two-component system phosphate regulon response regulator PhoB
MTKPFSVPELMARIAALLRRVQPILTGQETKMFGDLIIDFAKHRVLRGLREVHLGPTEFRLLQYLMEKPGDVLSRETLLKLVWGGSVYVELRTVDVHIKRLRNALNAGGEPDIIRTIRSAGYAMDMGQL